MTSEAITAPFLADAGLKRVLDAIEGGGDAARVVGGAVRNSLMGVAVTDLDIATTARPEAVSERARAAGLKVVPTGIDHGTVTVVVEGRPFEVTTLRADVETDGRRAVVAFTDDWEEDARRRDFTMNAIYVDRHGHLYDPVAGVVDARARRVRFIGEPEARIREDYLRILRFYRFHAQYGHGPLDAAGAAAAQRLAAGMAQLSRERVGAELGKILLAPGRRAAVAAMAAAGVLEQAIRRAALPERYAAVEHLAAAVGLAPDLERALAALCDDVEGVGEDLRLANRQRRRLAAIAGRAATLAEGLDEAAVRLAVYRDGNDVAEAALVLATALAGAAVVDPALLDLAGHWSAPRLPFRAADLMAEGLKAGPELGAELRRRERAWIAAGYPPGR